MPDPEPSPPRAPSPRSSTLAALGCAAALSLTFTPRSARAAEPEAELLSDPSLRTGREIAPRRARPTPDEAPFAACSFREAVCVHAAVGTHPAAVLATLVAGEQALRAMRAMHLPPPLPDGDLGGSSAFDLYLVPGERRLTTSIDPLALGSEFDTASAFAVLSPPSARSGCELPFTVATAIGEAILLRFDAGAEEGSVAMTSTYLASIAAPCSLVEIAAIDDLQRAPERPITRGRMDEPDGNFLFPELLDETRGNGAPAGLITALFAVATQKTPPGSWRFKNEPDLFDALRLTMKDRDKSLDDLLLDYAVARAFVGSRSDGSHLADVSRFGDMGRVRFEWNAPYTSLPRRLAPLHPIDSTGSTYLWLDLASAPKGSSLTFVADWELPVLFRWALVKIDANGMDAGRIDVAGLYGTSHAEKTIVDLDGLAGVLIVGMNDGAISREYPFDPDEAPFEPHAYTITLAK